jgi:hypothetical protein
MSTAANIGCVIWLASLGGCGGLDPSSMDPAGEESEQLSSIKFITRAGPELMNGNAVFRYSGANMHWLGLLQYADHWCGTSCGDPHLPTHREIDNAMGHAQTMGATVVRTMGALTVGCPQCIEPSLGSFGNFDSLDYAIASAKAHHIRLQMPLVDNYKYYLGGKFTYLEWRGITSDSGASDFFTNPTVISDYEDHIAAVLNHVNPYTGLAYKDDPTIYAWETGNEISVSPMPWTHSAWTGTISSYIKVTLGARQLVVDGHNGFDTSSLALPYVDVYSMHAYHNTTSPTAVANAAHSAHLARKAFILGEYTWTGRGIGDVPLDWTLTEMLRAVEEHGVNGDTYWELLADGVGSAEKMTLHWPGDTSNMRTRAKELQTHAFFMCHAGSPCRW